MVSSLAAQLSQNASLNSAFLLEKSRRKVAQSYLFSLKEADHHDLESIHALGVNGFLQLSLLEPSVRKYEDALFSDSAKVTDRTLLAEEGARRLDQAIEGFLPLLGTYLLEIPTGKVIEWLVRRFRINEFNVDSVLSLFLPYHESPHFAKILSILHIQPGSLFAPLLPFQSTTTLLSKSALVNIISSPTNAPFARFVSERLSSSLRLDTTSSSFSAVHRGLVAFHTSILLEFLKRVNMRSGGGGINDNSLTWLLTAIMDPLELCSSTETEPSKASLILDVILSSYLLLAALSNTCQFSPKAITAILKAIASSASENTAVGPKHVIRTMVCVCAGQERDKLEEKGVMSKKVVKAVLKLQNVVEELIDSVKFSSSENFIEPLLKAIIFSRLDQESAFQIVSEFLSHTSTSTESTFTLPYNLVHNVAKTCLDSFLDLNTRSSGGGGDAEIKRSRVRSLLVDVQQRYPKVWSKIFEELKAETQEGSDEEDDGDEHDDIPRRKEDVDRVLVLLSSDVQIPAISVEDLENDMDGVVGSASADANVRTLAIKELYQKLQLGGTSDRDDEPAAIRTALFARFQDTSLLVLESLYSNQSALLQIVLGIGVGEYVKTVAASLRDSASFTSGKEGRSIIKIHFDFLLNHLLTSSTKGGENDINDDQKAEIFYTLVFPYLLFTKPRRRTAKMVWELLDSTEKASVSAGRVGIYEVLAGCTDAVAWEEGQGGDGDRNSGVLVKINLAVASRIAENIISSNTFSTHVEHILSVLQQDEAHGRSLAYLVSRVLLSRLSGGQQVDIALRVLEVIKLGATDGMDGFLKVGENVGSALDDTDLTNAVYSKPGSRNTLHRLQAAILAVVSVVHKPSGVPLDLLADFSIPEEGLGAPTSIQDRRGPNYVQLMRVIYNFASTASTSSGILSGYLSQKLFVTLSSDCLSFLAGVWLHSFDIPQLRYSALRHSTAFLEAYVSLGCCVDFQTTLPSVLVMVGDEDPKVRGAAVECLEAIVRVSSIETRKPSGVYAFDAIYGVTSNSLQYLDWPDFVRYIRSLGDMKEHFVNDPSFVKVFHEQTLRSSRSDSKKEAGFKQRVIYYLLSHVNSCPLTNVKTSIMKILGGISTTIKLQMLLPALKGLLKDATEYLPDKEQEQDEYNALLVSSFDESSAKSLNDPTGSAWELYTQILRYFFQIGSPSSPRKALTHNLRRGLQSLLNINRQMELCQLLLEFCQRDQNLMSECREFVAEIVTDNIVAIRVLTALQPSNEDSSQRARKRAKVDTINDDSSLVTQFASLTILAEILAGISMTGSLDLATTLLETLSKVVHDESQESGEKVFTIQLLMSALENVATNMPVKEGTEITAQSLRLDILVELIRVSQNPQTFSQALLLAATLARLAPNAVLHNIMPIFTFMGSNVFHRDDTYSFKVVQKTIESIVPVMVSSLKSTNPTGLDLWIASRGFLRLFTDASNHIPRHRRTSFFSQLVDALGPQEFFAPICMLLADKVANRVVRQNEADSHNSLTLPLVLVQKYGSEIQLSTILELLRESKRLLEVEDGTEGPPHTFLETTSDDDHGVKTNASRQAQSLLVFVNHALKALASKSATKDATEPLTSEILLLLLDLGSSNRDVNGTPDDISKVVRSSILNALGVMSAVEFIRGTLVILQSLDALAKRGALELFAEQLPNISPKVRVEVTPIIVKIAMAVHKPLLGQLEDDLASLSFQALESITSSMCAGEETVLSNIVPQVMSYIGARNTVLDALNLLRSLVTKLGPRIIPYFKDIVKLCVKVLQEYPGPGEIPESAVSILTALLSSIPRFWGTSELTLVINIYLENEPSTSRTHSSQMTSFIKALTKKAPSKILLPLLCEMWQPMTSKSDENLDLRLSSYFNVFKRSLRVATRPVVSDHIRSLYATFLSIFQFFASTPAIRKSVEKDVISTFLEVVVKLNEAAFKPFFRKLFDWAFTSESGTDESRRTVFCHLLSALLDHLKSLMTPYMSFLLQSLISSLKAFEENDDEELWCAILQLLTKSFVHDDGVFWRNDKLLQLANPLIAQFPTCIRFNTPEAKSTLTDCLSAFIEVISDDALLKSTNIDILMHTRSEDPRLRLFTLNCSESLWHTHGHKLMGFVHETTTFIAEAAEDENDLVVKEAHRLKNAVESIAGPLEV